MNTDDNRSIGLTPEGAARQEHYRKVEEQELALAKARALCLNGVGLILTTGWVAGTVWLIVQAVEYVR